jgi:pyrroline-5-carboxylate reductase
LVVVAAGVKSADVVSWLSASGQSASEAQLPVSALFLAIPNIAIAHLCSMTFLVPVVSSDERTAQAKAMFDAMGRTLIVEERLLAAGTTLASCGLAYAMRYVRAAAEGGVELGFYPDQALSVVLQTVRGAVELLQASGEHPEAAIDKVTTPGGVTIKGLNEMEHAGFTSAVIRGLKAGMQ